MQVTSEEGYRLFKLGRWSTQKQMCLECLLLAKAGNERMCPAWEQRGSGTASAFRQKQMPSCHEDGFLRRVRKNCKQGGKTWSHMFNSHPIFFCLSSQQSLDEPHSGLCLLCAISMFISFAAENAKLGNGNFSRSQNAVVPSLTGFEGQNCLRVSADYSSVIFHSSFGMRAK